MEAGAPIRKSLFFVSTSFDTLWGSSAHLWMLTHAVILYAIFCVLPIVVAIYVLRKHVKKKDLSSE